MYPKVTDKDQNMKNQWHLAQLFRNDPNGLKAKYHHVKARNLKTRVNLSLLVGHLEEEVCVLQRTEHQQSDQRKDQQNHQEAKTPDQQMMTIHQRV